MFENSDLTENIEGKNQMSFVTVTFASVRSKFQRKTLCNAGSVGNPLEITQASYLIFEGTYNEKAKAFLFNVRVPYDIELAIRLAEELEMPEIEEYKQNYGLLYIEGLRKIS